MTFLMNFTTAYTMPTAPWKMSHTGILSLTGHFLVLTDPFMFENHCSTSLTLINSLKNLQTYHKHGDRHRWRDQQEDWKQNFKIEYFFYSCSSSCKVKTGRSKDSIVYTIRRGLRKFAKRAHAWSEPWPWRLALAASRRSTTAVRLCRPTRPAARSDTPGCRQAERFRSFLDIRKPV